MKSEGPGRQQNAAMLLSTTGAAIAGVGFGILFGERLLSYGAAILAVGLVAHLVGMISNRRSQEAVGYVQATWETVAYWLCWALIVALVGYIAIEVIVTR